MKKLALFLVLAVCSSLAITSCNKDDDKDVAVTGIVFNTNNPTSVGINETIALAVTISPSDATNKGLTWTSSDATVATVNNGNVKGIKEGTVTITVKTNDGGFSKECTITVTKATDLTAYLAAYDDQISEVKMKINAGALFNLDTTVNNVGENLTFKLMQGSTKDTVIRTYSTNTNDGLKGVVSGNDIKFYQVVKSKEFASLANSMGFSSLLGAYGAMLGLADGDIIVEGTGKLQKGADITLTYDLKINGELSAAGTTVTINGTVKGKGTKQAILE